MLNLSEKHQLIQKIAEKLAKEKVAPRAKEIDATNVFPWIAGSFNPKAF